ncbi:hypothetical protein [Dokdonella sp.]|uniref:hypothetical protein n=1 Tax=Dokdonella sp. TaxID=2291710 RepID=UPI003784CF10
MTTTEALRAALDLLACVADAAPAFHLPADFDDVYDSAAKTLISSRDDGRLSKRVG